MKARPSTPKANCATAAADSVAAMVPSVLSSGTPTTPATTRGATRSA